MRNIRINRYPALNGLLWDYHGKTIKGLDALKIYENRWHYVDTNNLINNERTLIQDLANRYGNGFFLPNCA